MSIVVRPAEIADVANLVALNRVVQAIHVAADPAFFRGDAETADLSTFFAERVSSEDSVVLLAEQDSRAMGYIWFDIQERAMTPFTHALKRMSIHHLVVHEDARRRGIASALMGAAKVAAVSGGVREIVLNTWSFNEKARAFFHVAGFEAFSFTMRKRFEADETIADES